MARHRKPSAEHEAKGAYRHNPDRRRVDPPGKGELPLAPPPNAALADDERACYSEIAMQIPENLATGSDAIAVELAARMLAQIRRGGEGVSTATFATLGNALSRLGLDPQGRMKLAPAAGKKKKPHEVDPLAEFTVGNQGQRGTVPAGGDGTN